LGPNLYRADEIEYKFNSHGFRCDEFNIVTTLPIVFSGCSITEGTGLHQHETWSYLLLEKIREKTNKIIPYWNIGVAASSIDTQAEYLHWLTTTQNINIKFIFGLFPPIYRRDLRIASDKRRIWLPVNPSAPSEIWTDDVSRVFSDEFYAQHQTVRSMMIIDSICRLNRSKMFYTFWNKDPENDMFRDNFPFLNLLSLAEYENTDLARDGHHFGPTYHSILAELYWALVEPYF